MELNCYVTMLLAAVPCTRSFCSATLIFVASFTGILKRQSESFFRVRAILFLMSASRATDGWLTVFLEPLDTSLYDAAPAPPLKASRLDQQATALPRRIKGRFPDAPKTPAHKGFAVAQMSGAKCGRCH
jgi:hypothetical protein